VSGVESRRITMSQQPQPSVTPGMETPAVHITMLARNNQLSELVLYMSKMKLHALQATLTLPYNTVTVHFWKDRFDKAAQLMEHVYENIISKNAVDQQNRIDIFTVADLVIAINTTNGVNQLWKCIGGLMVREMRMPMKPRLTTSDSTQQSLRSLIHQLIIRYFVQLTSGHQSTNVRIILEMFVWLVRICCFQTINTLSRRYTASRKPQPTQSTKTSSSTSSITPISDSASSSTSTVSRSTKPTTTITIATTTATSAIATSSTAVPWSVDDDDSSFGTSMFSDVKLSEPSPPSTTIQIANYDQQTAETTVIKLLDFLAEVINDRSDINYDQIKDMFTVLVAIFDTAEGRKVFWRNFVLSGIRHGCFWMADWEYIKSDIDGIQWVADTLLATTNGTLISGMWHSIFWMWLSRQYSETTVSIGSQKLVTLMCAIMRTWAISPDESDIEYLSDVYSLSVQGITDFSEYRTCLYQCYEITIRRSDFVRSLAVIDLLRKSSLRDPTSTRLTDCAIKFDAYDIVVELVRMNIEPIWTREYQFLSVLLRRFSVTSRDPMRSTKLANAICTAISVFPSVCAKPTNLMLLDALNAPSSVVRRILFSLFASHVTPGLYSSKHTSDTASSSTTTAPPQQQQQQKQSQTGKSTHITETGYFLHYFVDSPTSFRAIYHCAYNGLLTAMDALLEISIAGFDEIENARRFVFEAVEGGLLSGNPAAAMKLIRTHLISVGINYTDVVRFVNDLDKRDHDVAVGGSYYLVANTLANVFPSDQLPTSQTSIVKKDH
jgi:hypothetical protein